MEETGPINPLKEKIHEIIFEADTPMGKHFDVALLIFILASIAVVLLESIHEYEVEYAQAFFVVEWFFTIAFTIEYGLRLFAVYRPLKYATSFYGIVDLLSIIPTYLSLFFVGAHSLMVIRALRLLRIFRILKLGSFTKEGAVIMQAMRDSRRKIFVFLMFILVLVMIIGSVMYLVEGGQADSKFTSIPRSIYWAIVTITTVGYGDITPSTEFGQFLSAIVMLLGYAVIAVPTGIVSAELVNSANNSTKHNTQSCRYCGAEDHDDDAIYCKMCGMPINVIEK